MAGERLLGVMNNVKKEDKGDTTDLMFGVVTSASPLKIKVDNRYELTSDFLILSAMCKEMIITIPAHTHTVEPLTTEAGGTGPHTHEVPQHTTLGALPSIKLWRGLEVGDKVRMLRVNKGQSFYVLEREEGVV